MKYVLFAACLVAALVSPIGAQTFRLGDQPFRFENNGPVGDAYTRQAPTPRAYFRPTPTGDDQIGPPGILDGPNSDDRVSRMAGDLDHQLHLSYKHDLPEYNRRYVHFRAAMDEWEMCPKTIEQEGQMTQWLRTSMKYSMPGSDNFLPPLPKVNPVDLDSQSVNLKSVRDPFTDDPIQTLPR